MILEEILVYEFYLNSIILERFSLIVEVHGHQKIFNLVFCASKECEEHIVTDHEVKYGSYSSACDNDIGSS